MNPRLVLALALALAGCGKTSAEAGKAAIRFPVEAAAATAEPAPRQVSAPGSVTPRETARITSRVSGVIDRVLVQEGDVITAGAPVAEIDAARFRVAVDQAKAQLARAKAVVEDAAAALHRRERAAKDSPGLVSDEELAQSRARTAQAEADSAAAEAALARALLDLRDAQVSSPMAGTVQERLASTGDPVQPGTAIATVVDRSQLLLRFSVSVADAALLAPGAACAFRLPGEDRDRSASIILIAESADLQSRLVPVVARVAAADAAQVRPGAYAAARVDLPPGPDRVLVPALAVQPSERGYLAYVVAGVGDDATARERRVQVGAQTRDGRLEILSGIAAGELVVVRGAAALHDAAAVDVQKRQ